MKLKSEELPAVSVIVIGRNEAQNLPVTIQSIRLMNYPQDRLEVIYVDTDSTDGSAGVARSLGLKVYEEHSDFPSAAKARNRGWREAKYDIVHFVDGDMVVDPFYLEQAVKHLEQDHVACVIGQLWERHASNNIIAHILDYSWKVKELGSVNAPGAGGTFIKSILQEIGGYNSDLLRGEETELGFRLRELGYRILMIDHIMGTHDYGIHSVRGLCVRFYRIGHNFANVLLLPPSASLAAERRSAQRSAIEGIFAVFIFVGLACFRLWHIFPVLPILLASYVLARYWQPARLRYLRISYFMLDYFFKPVVWFGMAKKLFTQWILRR